MKLLLDEMWPPEIAAQLRRRGYDVEAVQERAELLGKADAFIFALAQEEGHAIVSENAADFRQLAAEILQQGRTHCGLIFTTNRQFPRHDPRTLGRIVVALAALLADAAKCEATNFEHWL